MAAAHARGERPVPLGVAGSAQAPGRRACRLAGGGGSKGGGGGERMRGGALPPPALGGAAPRWGEGWRA